MATEGIKCPKCGQKTVECVYWDDGATRHNDNFRHTCLNPDCDYREESRDNDGGDFMSAFPRPECPFCSRDAAEEGPAEKGAEAKS